MGRRIQACFLGLLLTALSQGQTLPRHLAEARQLLGAVSLDNTSYRHKENKINWGLDGTPATCDADCSGFVNLLLRHTYDWKVSDLEARFGKKRPLASDYFEAIQDRKSFDTIARVEDIQPGDFLAIKYPKDAENSGHIMLVDAAPVRKLSTKPIVTGLIQWDVRIIDSSKGPHGHEDRRYLGKNNKKDGLGSGTFRIYSDSQGTIQGYSWSVQPDSEFYGPDQRPLVAGRLKP